MSNFHISPTFKGTMDFCSMQAKFKYIDKLKKIKEDVALLRGRIVHRAVQIWLTEGALSYTQIENKRLISKLLCEYAGSDNPFGPLHTRYEFPPEANKRAYFSWDEFLLQLLSHLELIQNFILLEGIKPYVVDHQPAIEVKARYLLTYHGEILVEQLGAPISSHNIIDLIGVDEAGNIAIYDWKIGMKKYTRKHGLTPADTNDALISYAIGANTMGIPYPIQTFLIHTVVNKKGEKSENVEHSVLKGIEVVPRTIREDEIETYFRASALTAEDFLNMRFKRNKSDRCITMCDFNKICLKGLDKGYESWEKDDAR